MPRLRPELALVACLFAVTPAAATWLHCSAAGSDDNGPFGYETTLAGIHDGSPATLTRLQAKLVAYIGKTDASAHGVTAHCAAFEDEALAARHYSRALDAVARKLGWDHTQALEPAAWLGPKDLVESPYEP